MVDLPIAPSTFDRTVAKEPYISLKNRFLEKNPALNDSQVSAISRPALKKWIEVGEGPIRKVYSSSGTFGDDLFVVSGFDLYRVTNKGVATFVGTISTHLTGSVSMAATAPLGDTPAHLFIAEGGVFWLYIETGQALGHLSASGNPSAGDVVRVDGTYYSFVSTSVDAGTPAGTSGSPWLVKIGLTAALSMTNLYNAINATGVPGTDYSTLLTLANPTVYGYNAAGTDLYVAAKSYGTVGNAIPTTETSASLSWGATTLTTGGSPQLRQVLMPDDAGAVSVAHFNSYVIVVTAQTDNTKGRFYWVKPGETTVDALSFATAERSPDGINQVMVFGDMFWLTGDTTTEAWVTTGNGDAPMERFQGILYDRGSWPGTAVQVKDSFIVVDKDGGVFQIGNMNKYGSKPNRISRPDLEERIRLAMQKQAASLLP